MEQSLPPCLQYTILFYWEKYIVNNDEAFRMLQEELLGYTKNKREESWYHSSVMNKGREPFINLSPIYANKNNIF